MARFFQSFAWAGLLICLLAPLGACAVKKDNLYLFSAVKGRIVKNGEPVAGIKVERSTSWNMEQTPRIETTTTDENGFYEFSEMTGSAEFGFLSKLLHIPTINQEIQVYEGASEILIYVNVKNNYDKEDTDSAEVLRLETDVSNKDLITDNSYISRSKILTAEESF